MVLAISLDRDARTPYPTGITYRTLPAFNDIGRLLLVLCEEATLTSGLSWFVDLRKAGRRRCTARCQRRSRYVTVCRIVFIRSCLRKYRRQIHVILWKQIARLLSQPVHKRVQSKPSSTGARPLIRCPIQPFPQQRHRLTRHMLLLPPPSVSLPQHCPIPCRNRSPQR